MAHLITLFHGFCIGIANIIPGVSGGTLAVIFGIYDRIMSAINDLLSPKGLEAGKSLLKGQKLAPSQLAHLKLLGFLGLGAIVGVFSTSKLLSFLLTSYPNITLSLLFGFIIG